MKDPDVHCGMGILSQQDELVFGTLCFPNWRANFLLGVRLPIQFPANVPWETADGASARVTVNSSGKPRWNSVSYFSYFGLSQLWLYRSVLVDRLFILFLILSLSSALLFAYVFYFSSM